jgi:hypothetical protein
VDDVATSDDQDVPVPEFSQFFGQVVMILDRFGRQLKV